MTKRKFTFLSDGGHGWLSVSLKDIHALGVGEKISRCSFMNATRGFLEEDCDASIFLNAAKEAGWDITIKESDTSMSGPHWVRSLASFMNWFCEFPFTDGSLFSHKGINGKRVGDRLHMDGGVVYSIRKSNPLLALNPPR